MPERTPKPASVGLHFRLPAPQYDQLYAKAQEAGITVPEWIRRTVWRKLHAQPPRRERR